MYHLKLPCTSNAVFMSPILRTIVFLYFWLGWVFDASGTFLWPQRARATLQSRCTGFSPRRIFLWRMSSEVTGSAAVAPGLQSSGLVLVVGEFSWAVGVWDLPDQGSNPCLLYWQADCITSEPPEKSNMLHILRTYFVGILYEKISRR